MCSRMPTSRRYQVAAARLSRRPGHLSCPAMRLCHLALEAEWSVAVARESPRRWRSAPQRRRPALHARRGVPVSLGGCRTPCSHPVRTWPSDLLQASTESSSSVTSVMLFPVAAAAGSSFVGAHLLFLRFCFLRNIQLLAEPLPPRLLSHTRFLRRHLSQQFGKSCRPAPP